MITTSPFWSVPGISATPSQAVTPSGQILFSMSKESDRLAVGQDGHDAL